MKPTLQAILRVAWASFASRRSLPTRVTHAAAALVRCRTAEAGAQIWRCPDGHVSEIRYAPCGHRACPQCGYAHRARSLERWQRLLLPTDHFHVVFTVAHQLHELWRWNRAVVADLLFRCVRETLFSVLSDPRFLGARPGVLVALHTWGRTLVLHLHVHCLITAGGLDDTGQWCTVAGDYLAPGPLLRHRFRGQLLSGPVMLVAVFLIDEVQGGPDGEHTAMLVAFLCGGVRHHRSLGRTGSMSTVRQAV